MDMVHNLAEACQRRVESRIGGLQQIIVALHADAVDGHTALLHLLYHIIYTTALSRVSGIVVVIEQQCIGVGFVSKGKSLGNEFVATQTIKRRLAVGLRSRGLSQRDFGPLVRDGFIDHIPAIDHVLIAVDHRVDMFAQTAIKQFFRGGLSRFCLEHPLAELRMPTQAVPAQPNAIAPAEIGNAVGCFPVPNPLLRLQRSGLHGILRRDAVEVLPDERHLLFVRHIAPIHRHTYRKIIAIGLLESLGTCLHNGQCHIQET